MGKTEINILLSLENSPMVRKDIKQKEESMNFYQKLNRLNWGLLIFWLLCLAFCFACWYFVIYGFVKLIAKAQGWA